jgi:hypothetical protein
MACLHWNSSWSYALLWATIYASKVWSVKEFTAAKAPPAVAATTRNLNMIESDVNETLERGRVVLTLDDNDEKKMRVFGGTLWRQCPLSNPHRYFDCCLLC